MSKDGRYRAVAGMQNSAYVQGCRGAHMIMSQQY